jgi:DNA-binding MarR family transcriptional regulator
VPEPLLGSTDAVTALADRLSQIAYVERQPTPHDEPPSWTLADSLRDIELEFRRLLDEQLPGLIHARSANQLEEALAEIRMSLQHVVYHLATTPYLRGLIDDAPPLFEDG